VYLTNERGSTKLCRHGLGSGNKVCFANKKQDAETCGINHCGDEFILERNSFYILAKTSPVQQAFPSPILDATHLTANFGDYLKNQTKDSNEWFRLFALVKLTLKNREESVGASQVDQHQCNLDQPLQTPRRPRGRLRFDETEVVDVDSEGELIEGQGPPAASEPVWDNIPDTPFINAEEFSTEEQRESWATEPASFPYFHHQDYQGRAGRHQTKCYKSCYNAL
jgi:hypothetical protein